MLYSIATYIYISSACNYYSMDINVDRNKLSCEKVGVSTSIIKHLIALVIYIIFIWPI